MEDKINEILQAINLSKNEREVYLDLIKHRRSSILDIARRTKIHRTNVYDAIRKLKERGLAAEMINDEKKSFIAGSPERIIRYLDQLKQDFNSIIPHLTRVDDEIDDKEDVTLFHGILSLKEFLLDLIKMKKPIKVYGIPKEVLDYLNPPFLVDFHKLRMKNNISMYHIYNENVTERIVQLNKMKNTYARHLSKKYDALASTLVCGDVVLFILFTKNLPIIKIKNKAIAETYDKYFDLLWKQAKV